MQTEKIMSLPTMQCAIDLTKNAQTNLLKWFSSEQAFFSTERIFHLFIEKRPENRQQNTSYYLYFHNETNKQLNQVLQGKVAILECVIENQKFLAIGFQVKNRREPVVTNRRYEANIRFVYQNRQLATTLPIELYTALRELPVAEERSEYVKKRISSWEGYLKVQELHADVEDIEVSYHQLSFNHDQTKVIFTCPELSAKQLRHIEGFSVQLFGQAQDIGQVTKVKANAHLVEVELLKRFQSSSKRQEILQHAPRKVVFSNFATLSQIRRLRKGFKDLQNGLAANPNLEKILFEERPVVKITNKKEPITFHSHLNDYQKEAVSGAMNAHDLYVIQGPPGTGKTTVIAEICYQNVQAGLKTLVASQANLAVDNALGRLLDDPDIRILRYGRTESIEEEGRKFIEENVAEYWKEQTMHQISSSIAEMSNVKQHLHQQKDMHQEQLKSLDLVQQQLRLKVDEKAEAQKKLIEYEKVEHRLLQEQDRTQKEQTALAEDQAACVAQIKSIESEVIRLQQDIATFTFAEGEREQLQSHQEQLLHITQLLKDYVVIENYRKLLEEHQEIIERQQTLETQSSNLEAILQSYPLWDTASEWIEGLGNNRTQLSEEQHDQLSLIDEQLKKVHQAFENERDDAREKVEERVEKAIPMLENILKAQGFFSNQITQRPIRGKLSNDHRIHDFLNRMGQFLVQPNTKKMFETRSFSSAKFDALERIADAYVLLLNVQADLSYRKRSLCALQQQIEKLEQEWKHVQKMLAGTLKEKHEKLVIQQSTLEIQAQETASNIKDLKHQIVHINQDIYDFNEYEDLKQQHEIHSLAIDELMKHNAVFERLQNELHETESKKVLLQNQWDAILLKQNEFNQVHEHLEEALEANTKEKAALKRIVSCKPEEELAIVKKDYASAAIQLQSIDQQLQQFPVKIQTQKKWLDLLQQSTEYDLAEIKKLYIHHANIIGTTCVASARKEFVETYPEFDVVIIDEVSKATPPELLLPMLKGKKIILVGDHHQLPPLIGQDTMEEFLESIENKKDQKELAQLLQESLFERLFRTLPKQNKTMLGIQYRMHEKIMQTISPFYEAGDYQLLCGLDDSDHQRNHFLETTLVNSTDHLLWLDIPNDKPYFEQRVKGGTSRFNEQELKTIKQQLIALNQATANAIEDGRMPKGAQKNIGIISFYGEQVKRVQQMIQQDLTLPHLHCRTGSVDKFQGMEMDVIILSFVRNHDQPNGDIGFAKDYRRLNVALSRARELLMIIGSVDMFTKKPKDEATRKLYTRLFEQIDSLGGIRKFENEVVYHG